MCLHNFTQRRHFRSTLKTHKDEYNRGIKALEVPSLLRMHPTFLHSTRGDWIKKYGDQAWHHPFVYTLDKFEYVALNSQEMQLDSRGSARGTKNANFGYNKNKYLRQKHAGSYSTSKISLYQSPVARREKKWRSIAPGRFIQNSMVTATQINNNGWTNALSQYLMGTSIYPAFTR